MPISVFSDVPLTLEQLQRTIRSAEPRVLAAQVRAWLLSGPRFGEFEGLCRFVEREDVAAALREKLPVEKWAVVGGYTARPVVAALRACLLARGICGDLFEANYNAFDAEILDQETALYRFHPSDVLVCTGHTSLTALPGVAASSQELQQATQAALDYFTTRWESLRSRTGARIHQHNFDHAPVSCLGRLEPRYPWTRNRSIDELNQRFWERDGRDILVVDIASLQRRVGSQNWWSPRWYHHGKLGFSPECLGDYARLLFSHVSAARGTSRRCLVVDLDNTLWGGVVGDEGVTGVTFGSGDGAGEAYLAFCRYLKRLVETGVILGVVSKNDEGTARSMFLEHLEMPLTLTDFAAFRANWLPKSDNLRELASELNIGLDSVVFLDDNAAECDEVSRAEPEVIVLQARGDTSDLAEQLDRLQLFDRLAFTSEDAERTVSYRGLRLAEAERHEATDLKTFLRDLAMVGQFGRPSDGQTSRVAQLFAKTNQFKLSQRTFSDTELTQMQAGGNRECYFCQLTDRHARHGIISAIVVQHNEQTVDIDNWVMSCRVFNRTVEEFMLIALANEVRQRGARFLRATLHLLPRNHYVHDLFDRLGFELMGQDARSKIYQLDVGRPLSVTSQILSANPPAGD